jgi:hypothetical protein
MQYFQFEDAVTVVTRLLRPIKTYVHTLGILFFIYVDDGCIAASSAQLCTEQTSFLLLVLQLAGWKIQWKKTVLTPSTSLLHLGLITDSAAMRYFITPEKWDVILLSLSSLLDTAAAGRPAVAKEVAAGCGEGGSVRPGKAQQPALLTRLSHEGPFLLSPTPVGPGCRPGGLVRVFLLVFGGQGQARAPPVVATVFSWSCHPHGTGRLTHSSSAPGGRSSGGCHGGGGRLQG